MKKMIGGALARFCENKETARQRQPDHQIEP